MAKDIKKSDRIFKGLIKLTIVLFAISIIIFGLGFYKSKQAFKKEKQVAMSKIPVIETRIESFINDNKDINKINYNFEYKGTNFIELYVTDSWFYSTDIEKKRFAKAVQENVKSILFEEGFIRSDGRLGIYVMSIDGISLAESNINNEIKLKD